MTTTQLAHILAHRKGVKDAKQGKQPNVRQFPNADARPVYANAYYATKRSLRKV